MSTMQGELLDKFIRSSEARQYLQDRSDMGAGSSDVSTKKLR